MDSLVSTDWLDAERGAPDLRIADASLFLPEHGRDARAEFVAAHIQGAVFLDLDELRDTDSALPNTIPTRAKFASRMGRLGLGDGTRIVLYDASPLHSSARAWWLMRHFGVERVAILDGGLDAWRREDRAIEAGEVAPRPRHFTVRDPLAEAADKAAVAAALAEGVQVADARGAARFAGEEPEPRADIVPGHMPGARNLHYARLFEEDGRWRRGEALAHAFRAAGLDPGAPLVTTCGSGVTAAVIAFAAHLLGQGDVRLYDGSWAEWGSDPATPKATGRA